MKIEGEVDTAGDHKKGDDERSGNAGIRKKAIICNSKAAAGDGRKRKREGIKKRHGATGEFEQNDLEKSQPR